MKKIIILTLSISILFIVSCQRNTASKPSQEDDYSYTESGVVTSGISTPGYTLRVSSGFYTILGEDNGEETTRTRWASGISLGESLMTGEIRRMTFDTGSVVQDWIAIRRDNGSTGWAIVSQVAAGGRLGVITEDRAFLHTQPRTVDVSRFTLSRRSVIVFYPESENNGFVEVRGWDIERQQYVQPNNNFVRLSAISRRDADIQSAILLITALSLPEAEKARRDNLLESALLDYSDSIFYNEILAIANPNTSGVIDPHHGE